MASADAPLTPLSPYAQLEATRAAAVNAWLPALPDDDAPGGAALLNPHASLTLEPGDGSGGFPAPPKSPRTKAGFNPGAVSGSGSLEPRGSLVSARTLSGRSGEESRARSKKLGGALRGTWGAVKAFRISHDSQRCVSWRARRCLDAPHPGMPAARQAT